MTTTFLRPDASFSEASSPSIIPNFATIWMARSWLHQNRFLARKFTQIQIAKIPIVVLLGRTACGWAARRCLKAGWRSEPSTAALRFCPTGLVASLSHTQKKLSFLPISEKVVCQFRYILVPSMPMTPYFLKFKRMFFLWLRQDKVVPQTCVALRGSYL